MILKECIFTNSDCYKKNELINGYPKGIVVHSTGAKNPSLKRYVQPTKGSEEYAKVIKDLGLNQYGNSWNNPGITKCDHGFIGKNAQGKIETYQTLPYEICCWGCGKGKNGSYNYNPTAHIQFEICEDGLNDEVYFKAVMREAQEYCAYLCKCFDLPVDVIVSHKEAHDLGYASNHGDIDHWLKKFKKNMAWFRNEVQNILVPKPLFELKVGDVVKVDKGAKWFNGKNIASWVFNSKMYVRKIDGNKITISIFKIGLVTGVIDKLYLKKI